MLEYAKVNDPELAGQMVGSLQGKVLGNFGTSVVVSGAAAKTIQKVAQLKNGTGKPTSAPAAGKANAGKSAPSTPEKLAGPTENWKSYTHAEAITQTASSGKMVNADKAIIDVNKLTSYALNKDHPVGGNKAKVFESALGYNQSNVADLITKVQNGVKNNPVKMLSSDKYGQRMAIEMPITGPNGQTAIVRTGWIYDTGSSVPRLTTIYVN